MISLHKTLFRQATEVPQIEKFLVIVLRCSQLDDENFLLKTLSTVVVRYRDIKMALTEFSLWGLAF